MYLTCVFEIQVALTQIKCYRAGGTGLADPATAGPIFSFTRMILIDVSVQKPQSTKSSSVCRVSLPVSVSSSNRCAE